jgi:hypothetical protein
VAVISGGWISKEKLVLILAQGTQLVNIVCFRELTASSLDFLWLSSVIVGSVVDIFVFKRKFLLTSGVQVKHIVTSLSRYQVGA